MTKHSVESTGFSPSKRIILGEGNIVGLALALSDGRWGAFSLEERPLTERRFPSPQAVAKWFDEVEAKKEREE
jgi:hypothetical protein